MGITVFTGAGASKPLGFPTTVEFFNEEITGVNWTLSGNDVYSRLCDFLGAEIIDVEDALRILDPIVDFLETEAGRFTKEFTSHRSSNNIDLNSFRNVTEHMKNRCFDLYGKTPNLNDVEKLYLKFLHSVGWEKHNVDLFTTNYDLTTDRILQIARQKNIPTSDGFNALSRFIPDEYKFRSNSGLRIYRLHGSMSWVEEGDEIINNRTISRTGRRHLYIAPGYKGNPESSNEPEPIIYAHQSLEMSLKNNSNLVVVGFSFRDPYLNLIFEKAFEENEKLSMVYIVPEVPTQSDSGFPHLRERFEQRIKVLGMRLGDKGLPLAMENAFEELGQRFC